jgi:hypothetical protein
MIRCIASDLSRHGAALACVLAFSASVGASAQDSGASPPPTAESQAEPSSGTTDKLGLGVMLDVGAPDGIGLSVAVRPIRWLRINAGLATNTLSVGVRGGISLLPLSSIVSPSLNLDVGHYLDANYNDLIDRLGGIPLRSQIPISDVAFNYAGASLGLEIGKPERFSVYLRVGLTHGSMTIDETQALLQDVTGDTDLTATPLTLRFTVPSVKLGFLLYIF